MNYHPKVKRPHCPCTVRAKSFASSRRAFWLKSVMLKGDECDVRLNHDWHYRNVYVFEWHHTRARIKASRKSQWTGTTRQNNQQTFRTTFLYDCVVGCSQSLSHRILVDYNSTGIIRQIFRESPVVCKHFRRVRLPVYLSTLEPKVASVH